MAIGIVKNNTSVAVEIESTEGTYVAETGATSFVEVLEDIGFGLEREQLTREVLTNTVEDVKARLGTKAASGTLPTELKASSTEGGAPQGLDELFQSLLGGKRTRIQVTSDTGHTASQINLDAGTVLNFAVNDLIRVEESGAHWNAAVTAVDTGVGTESITIFPAATGAFTDNVVISPVTQYYHSYSDLKTLSLTHYIGGEIREKVLGARAESAEIGNWSTGQLPQVAFNMQGLDLQREDGAPLFTPSFESSVPPVLLEACAYLRVEGGSQEELQYNEFSMSIANELARQPSACAESGFIGTRVTGLSVTYSINPYMDDTDLSKFNAFLDNDDVEFFVSASNPTSTDGETDQNVLIWVPQSTITAIPQGDVDGIVTDAIEGKAHRESGGDSIFIGFV